MMNGAKIHVTERTVVLSNATARQIVAGNLDRVALILGLNNDASGYFISLNPKVAINNGMLMASPLPFAMYIRDYGNIVQQPLFAISVNDATNIGIWEMILPGFSRMQQEQ